MKSCGRLDVDSKRGLTGGTDGKDSELAADDVEDAVDVRLGVLGERGVIGDMRGLAHPAGHLLVDGRAVLQDVEIGRERLIDEAVLALVTGTDLDHGTVVEDVQLGHRPEVDAIHALRITGHDRVEPAAATGTTGGSSVFAAALAELLAVRIQELGRERTFTHAGRVELEDADDAVDRARRDAGTRAGAASGRVGARHEGIGAEVDVEHRRLGSFEKDALLLIQLLVQELDRVGDVRHQRLHHGRIELDHLLRIQRLSAERDELAVRLGDLLTDEIEEVGLEDIADAHAVTADLGGVGGTDSAARGADLLALGTRRLLGLVDRAMPLHHHLGALGDMEASAEVEAPALHFLEFAHQVERIHHDAVADNAVLAVVKNSRRNEVENVFLLPDDDRMAGVGTSLETDHNIRFLGEEVNDLALAFIAPLGANEYSIHRYPILYQIFGL